MKVALCCIGRLENQYAVEYVEYYKSIGFDKIFIYDNNHDGEEHFEDVLQSYIDDGFVTVIDYRNKEAAQLSAYNDCYSRYGKEYDWIAFFDFDEFLTLVKDKDIKSYLSHFDDFQGVKINWMVYTDNNIIKNDGRKVLERFTTPMDYDKCVTYKFPENNHTKSIIRCGIENLKWNQTPHTVSNIKYCNSIGDSCSNSPFEPYNFELAYIKHFTTKTIEEWINNKIKRGYPDGNKDWFKKNSITDKFFKYNGITDEKNEYIKNNLQPSLKIYICTHKEFEQVVHSSVYEVVNANDINDDTAPNGLKGSFYSELMAYKYIAENFKLPKYVGFCCYRKYFSFLDDIPDIDKIFSEYDAVCSKPKILKTNVKSQYLSCHNIEDLYIIGGIIAEKYPEQANMWHNFINGNILIPYNMFIMKREDFKEYIDFIFSILDEYLKIVGTDINKRIYDNYEKYIKRFYPNDTVEYQYRIGGYAAERLTNLFMMHKFKKIKTYPVIVTEDKYNQK
jgi:disulfide oxidoreductase YuzD